MTERPEMVVQIQPALPTGISRAITYSFATTAKSSTPTTKTCADCQQLLSSYRELQSTCSAFEAQNTALREELERTDRLVDEELELITLEKTRSEFDEAFETAKLGHDVSIEFYEKLKLAVADRDDIYEQANTLAAMHHCECHDGRLWCAECRLTYPCPSLEIAIHILQRIDASEQR